ncbi:MAG: BMP family protein, partial [Anaerolineae bacterium]
VAVVLSLSLVAWPPAAAQTPVPKLKVGQVTDMGGLDDRSFNATAWKGIADAIVQLDVAGHVLESHDMADYERNITEFLREEYDLIITVGFLLGDATKAAAEANPDRNFAIVDFNYDPEIPNVLGLTFATDEAAFLAGYLAAAMTKTGKVGAFGGIKIPTVTIFEVGFESGINYYNQQHGTNVELLGWKTDPAIEGGGDGIFVGNFESTDDGRRVGESLIDEGADILMPVAGPVGIGTAAACMDRGTMMIGVDTDWYISAPEFFEVYLTSVLKNMDVAVFDAIKALQDGAFAGGTYVGTLENNGVGLARFHDFDAQVSEEVKTELEEIKQGIIEGTIETGWPPMPPEEPAEGEGE